ncbi:hypothetical protein ACFPVX_13370 [Cohnella faecalis]|uniref:Uncharacterized protein n=1 Tax=Cohnella faecalis TaxID=2315694 RepID=A0A398CJQ6_9BACL|nr:hypothetical protein [Cohnella faecalis]RIE02585.1 hypothetical protein D3H35_18045 [Cohnella faecalis]
MGRTAVAPRSKGGLAMRHERFAGDILGKYGPIRRGDKSGAPLVFRSKSDAKTKPVKATPSTVHVHVTMPVQPMPPLAKEQMKPREKAVVKERIVEREKIVEKLVVSRTVVVREVERIIREQRLLREQAVKGPVAGAHENGKSGVEREVGQERGSAKSANARTESGSQIAKPVAPEAKASQHTGRSAKQAKKQQRQFPALTAKPDSQQSPPMPKPELDANEPPFGERKDEAAAGVSAKSAGLTGLSGNWKLSAAIPVGLVKGNLGIGKDKQPRKARASFSPLILINRLLRGSEEASLPVRYRFANKRKSAVSGVNRTERRDLQDNRSDDGIIADGRTELPTEQGAKGVSSEGMNDASLTTVRAWLRRTLLSSRKSDFLKLNRHEILSHPSVPLTFRRLAEAGTMAATRRGSLESSSHAGTVALKLQLRRHEGRQTVFIEQQAPTGGSSAANRPMPQPKSHDERPSLEAGRQAPDSGQPIAKGSDAPQSGLHRRTERDVLVSSLPQGEESHILPSDSRTVSGNSIGRAPLTARPSTSTVDTPRKGSRELYSRVFLSHRQPKGVVARSKNARRLSEERELVRPIEKRTLMPANLRNPLSVTAGLSPRLPLVFHRLAERKGQPDQTRHHSADAANTPSISKGPDISSAASGKVSGRREELRDRGRRDAHVDEAPEAGIGSALNSSGPIPTNSDGALSPERMASLSESRSTPALAGTVKNSAKPAEDDSGSFIYPAAKTWWKGRALRFSHLAGKRPTDQATSADLRFPASGGGRNSVPAKSEGAPGAQSAFDLAGSAARGIVLRRGMTLGNGIALLAHKRPSANGAASGKLSLERSSDATASNVHSEAKPFGNLDGSASLLHQKMSANEPKSAISVRRSTPADGQAIAAQSRLRTIANGGQPLPTTLKRISSNNRIGASQLQQPPSANGGQSVPLSHKRAATSGRTSATGSQQRPSVNGGTSAPLSLQRPSVNGGTSAPLSQQRSSVNSGTSAPLSQQRPSVNGGSSAPLSQQRSSVNGGTSAPLSHKRSAPNGQTSATGSQQRPSVNGGTSAPLSHKRSASSDQTSATGSQQRPSVNGGTSAPLSHKRSASSDQTSETGSQQRPSENGGTSAPLSHKRSASSDQTSTTGSQQRPTVNGETSAPLSHKRSASSDQTSATGSQQRSSVIGGASAPMSHKRSASNGQTSATGSQQRPSILMLHKRAMLNDRTTARQSKRRSPVNGGQPAPFTNSRSALNDQNRASQFQNRAFANGETTASMSHIRAASNDRTTASNSQLRPTAVDEQTAISGQAATMSHNWQSPMATMSIALSHMRMLTPDTESSMLSKNRQSPAGTATAMLSHKRQTAAASIAVADRPTIAARARVAAPHQPPAPPQQAAAAAQQAAPHAELAHAAPASAGRRGQPPTAQAPRAPAAALELRRSAPQASPAQPEPSREIKIDAPPQIDAEQLKQALSSLPQLNPDQLADQVYKSLMKKMKFEQRLRGF